MRRVWLLAVLMMLPSGALAEDKDKPTRSVPEGVIAPASGSGVLLIADRFEQTPAPAARGGSGSSRRPSMVGYVDDATINSQIRVRFDAGQHTHYPDRAEFFYGKCGCYRGLPTTNAAYDPDAAGPGPGYLAGSPSISAPNAGKAR